MNPRALLLRHDIHPRRALGQNFLHDPGALRKILAAAELDPAETVLEIGAGTGALTRALAPVASQVLAVELDPRFIPLLRAELASCPNTRILHADILELDLASLLAGQPWLAVANLPYYITSAILRRLLECLHKPRRLVLTVQRELAERILARPGQMSLLAIGAQFHGRPRIIGHIGPAAFWPRPEVESAILRIDLYTRPPVDAPDERLFFRVARAGFSQKRKQLRNALAGGLGIRSAEAAELLAAAGIAPTRRAQTLSLAEWAALAQVYARARS